ncbi:uncharacterized protein ATNIH1004_008845 [Aspergillus tanneri]|uniref:Arrestin-like N-terminal domain-containing protein n=1 Tax=Aspergillus tanneri TaxID=1220188 RepID=A0A5M9MJP5_9EURO|nr:uncharacterized protein ATNIH1004_008845 [Aspergillus tanneri]KAA8644639.1 hypothetical protein ATNIH1004_008845 [Aspergillus tanneri]
MLSRVERFFESPSRMDLRIQLKKEQPVYTNEDEVSGHVVLRNEAEVDITKITIKLSGSATSRLDSGKLTELHELFKRNKQVFPPSHCASWFTSGDLTVSPGEHAFPFSIRFPQVSECYKAHTTDIARKRSASRQPRHLLRKLPPSTGDRTTPEEIKSIAASPNTVPQARDVYFHPISVFSPPLHSLAVRKVLICSPDGSNISSSSPLTYEIVAELLHGPFLLLGHPISLRVKVLGFKLDDSNVAALLHDFQSMLIENTEVRSCGSTQVHSRSWITQTMSNLRQPLVVEDSPASESILTLNDTLWSRHCVPLHLTPTFEICNLSRSYHLVVRLGIEVVRNNDIGVSVSSLYFIALILDPPSSETRQLHCPEIQALEKELDLESA